MPPRLPSTRALLPLLLAVFVALTIAAPVGARAQAPAPPAKRISPPGYALRISSSMPAPAGARTRGTVRCPKGTVPLSGGAFVADVDLQVNLSDSFPSGSSWVVDISNASSTDNSFEAVATCAQKMPHYQVVSTRPKTLMPSSSKAFFVTCPSGSHPLGGGVGVASADNSPVGTAVTMAANLPHGRQWQVSETNTGVTGALVTAVVVCGTLSRYRVLAAPATSVPAGSQGMVSVSCPAPTVVTGGGAVADLLNLAVGLAWSTMDEGFDWFAAVNIASGVSADATAVVVCAS